MCKLRRNGIKQIALTGVLFLIAIRCVPASCQSAKLATQKPKPTAEQEILAAERKWLDAFYSLDMLSLEATESADFTMLVPPGMVTKDQQLKIVQQRSSVVGTPKIPVTYTLENQTVRIYGNVALVSDTCAVAGGGDSRTISPGRYWQTEVWRLRVGGWKLVHVHISTVEHGM